MDSNIYKEAALKFDANKLKNAMRFVGGKVKSSNKSNPPIKNVSTSVDNFKENLKNSGLKIKGGQQGIDEAASDLTKSDFGLAGMVGGGVYKGTKKIYKKIPEKYRTKTDEPLKKIVTKSKDVREKADNFVANANMKAGEIGYNHAPGKTKNLFVENRKVKLDSSNPDIPQYGEFGVAKGTEPLNKAKKVILPLAGGAAISGQLEKLKYKPYEQQDENIKKVANENVTSIDKVTNIVENKIEEKTFSRNGNLEPYSKKELSGYFEKMSKLASDASTQLMLASYIKDTLIEKNSTLEAELNQLKVAFNNMEKSQKVEKLANDMLSRGMLIASDYNEKVGELKNLDDKAFDLFKEAVYKMPPLQSPRGLDKISYVVGTSECSEYDRERKKQLYETFDN